MCTSLIRYRRMCIVNVIMTFSFVSFLDVKFLHTCLRNEVTKSSKLLNFPLPPGRGFTELPSSLQCFVILRRKYYLSE